MVKLPENATEKPVEVQQIKTTASCCPCADMKAYRHQKKAYKHHVNLVTIDMTFDTSSN